MKRSHLRFALAMLAGLLHLTTCGQQKKPLTEQDYGQWHTLATGPVSPDGKWVAYSMAYPNGKDTLYLKNRDKDQLFPMPGAHAPEISGDGQYFLCIRNDSVKARNLKNGVSYTMGAGNSFLMRGNIVFVSKDDKLSMHKLGAPGQIVVQNVTEYAVNAKGVCIVARETAGVATLELHKPGNSGPPSTVLSDAAVRFHGLRWAGGGTAFAVFATSRSAPATTAVYRVDLNHEPQIAKMVLPAGLAGYTVSQSGLTISDDGKRIFCDLEIPDTAEKGTGEPIVYKHSDLTIPPMAEKKTYWHLWKTDTDSVIALEDKEYPTAIPTADYRYILAYSHQNYFPLHENHGYYMDLAIIDLATGQRRLIVAKQRYHYQQVLLSPAGKFMAYFKNKQWWLYDIEAGLSRKIEGAVPYQFFDTENDYPHEAPYGIAGWSNDDTHVLVYDQYDIWLVNSTTGASKRITKGREKNLIYRLYDNRFAPVVHQGFGFTANGYDLEKGFFILGQDGADYGYEIGYYTKRQGLRTLGKGSGSVTSLLKAGHTNDIFFLESDFDSPPKLVHSSPSGKRNVIVRSNKQQENYFWGTSELISYDACGKTGLKAALFYPADYDPKKSYPMIVNIYQDKSKEVNRYVPPSLKLFDGFNTTNFTTRGYFVLMPDIHYIMDHPGQSALECVLAASQAALVKASIKKDRIALMGHSFGGFETSYIVSQTDFFRTAIAGAGISDLLNFYLDVDPYQKSNMERFDDGQYRNKQPFYTPAFSAESPLNNIKGINTPLLLWSGSDDMLVPAANSIRLHSALWQLGKKSTLLLYPHENHVIEKPDHQADLYHRISGWLDFYLKDSEMPVWLE